VTLYLQLLQAARQGDGQGLQMVGAQGQQHLLNSLFYEAAVQGAEKLGFTAAEIAEVTGALRGTTVATTGGVTAGAQAGAATGAASGSATGAATTTSMASAASRVLGAAGAAYSLYSLYKNWGQSSPGEGAINGAAVGAYVGTTICPGVGTVVGGAIGACVGAIAGCFKKSGKHKDQVARDQVRAFLQDGGLLSKDWEVALKNGGRYSIGADGNDRLMNLDGTTRRAYEVDFTDPRAGEIVSLAAPIVVVLLGGRGKLTDDFTGYLTNAALSNALSVNEAKENIRAIFQGMGLSQDGVQQALDILVTTDKIRPEEHAIFSASLNEITNNEGVTSSKQPPGDRRRGGAKPLTPPRDKSREG
jgi:hypothetical protein